MRFATLSGAVILAIGVSACGGEGGDDALGSASQAEIDPGTKDYIIYSMVDDTGLEHGVVLVTATAGAGFAANTEYWYMTSNLSNSSAITFSGGTSTSWSSPPSGLGTLSFSTARTPSWSSATARGTYPVYSSSMTGEYDGMNWQMTVTHGVWSGEIVWSHNSTGNLFGDSVVRRLAPVATSGTHEFYTSTPL